MKRFFLTLFSFFVLSNIALSQDKLNSGGMLSLGTRTTISAFNDDKNETSLLNIVNPETFNDDKYWSIFLSHV